MLGKRKILQRKPGWLYGLLLLLISTNSLLAGCSLWQTPTQTIALPVEGSTQPASTLTPELAASATLSATETVPPGTVDAYPYPGGSGQAYPQPGAYPGSTYPSAGSSYPAAGSQPYPSPVGQTATSQIGYPAPGAATASPSAAPGAAPSATFTASPSATATITASGPTTTSQPLSSPTSVATLTPTISPTPTVTQTPTPSGPTATPRPELQASDPGQVRLDSGKVQLVEFFTYWCGSCRAMAPIIHRLEARYYERVNFVYLDVDDPATVRFRQALFFRRQPEFYLLDEDGKVLKHWPDYVMEAELEAAILAALQ